MTADKRFNSMTSFGIVRRAFCSAPVLSPGLIGTAPNIYRP
jgi:hypothetical protein